MFNLQGSEIVIILLLALVVLGPEKLPEAMRKAGKAYSELKKMSSGFQSEFRAVVDEPMREIRETANVLRDSADFTKLQEGQRDEKPKSGEMAPVDPDAVPTDATPTFDTPSTSGPSPAADSAAAPFDEDDRPAGAARSELAQRTPITTSPPFTGMSSAAPRPEDSRQPANVDNERPQPFSGVSSAAPRPPDTIAGETEGSASTSEPVAPEEPAPADAAHPDVESVESEREAAVADGDR